MPLYFILKPELAGGVPVLLAAFIACFLMMLALTDIARGAESFMLLGGVLTALSLLFGGVIYPAKLFPLFAKRISVLTIPKYLLAGLEKAEPAVSVLPLLIIAAACLALFIAAELITHGGRAKRRRAA